MWLLFSITHAFLIAVVGYIDEYLTGNNKISKNESPYKRIGGLVLISTILSFVGAFLLYVFFEKIQIELFTIIISSISAIFCVGVFFGYFYLLNIYPAYQVVPMLQTSALWLLLIEMSLGEKITSSGLMGVFALMIGAYFLDAGKFEWQIPTKLLRISIIIDIAWALNLFLVKIASESAPSSVVSFWQFLSMGIIGVLLFIIVKNFREGLIFRIKNQGKNFLGFSFLSESLSQTSYALNNLAVALAPMVSYVSAIDCLQGIFLMVLFLVLPWHEKRTPINKVHIFSIFLIAIGVLLIKGI